MTGTELFGYIASVIVALSLMMKNIKHLRWWNLLGAALFSAYGLMIGAMPVFVLNGFIALADIYYLRQLYLINDTFELLPVDIRHTKFLVKFLEYYKEDILNFFPDFRIEQLQDPEIHAYYILRDMLPVSLILYKKEDRSQKILLDYAIPAYRDLKNASFFYHLDADTLGLPRDSVFTVESKNPAHNRYLKKIGFKGTSSDPFHFSRSIA